ncbi:excinuclease ABC subunit C [candidate division KSB3 bacterium]|uniref:UvrABC system protein C n=1 Tax=candidate division KSB3 bacterium TaxID=2044937 RepID=A0A2G6E5Z6_9BACT|nr:MAG: excinuclease ABC subunit C [candidate division KSB3 bacterium]PIE30072.1 MAG: excinuclease ABC subunit C [candidate division KSB3 bacterium]
MEKRFPHFPNVQETLKNLPLQPGVYLMKGLDGQILYVGKAKRLRHRVRSYFSKNLPSQRIAAMVLQIAKIDYIVTDSELEALILEATLIKKHKPHYNVALKDDKHFPYVTLTLHEAFPRIITVRKIQQDGALYFGPYVRSGALQQTLKLAKRFFPLRLCSGDITYNCRARPCFEYEIHRCLGPCAGKCAPEEYWNTVEAAKLFLQGKKNDLLTELRDRMQRHAERLEFEKAAALRDHIKAVRHIMERQKVISTAFENQDVIASARRGPQINVQIFFIRNGILMGRRSFNFSEVAHGQGRHKGSDSLEEREVLRSVVEQFYLKDLLLPDEILLAERIPNQHMIEEWLTDRRGKKVSCVIPQRGRKKQLIALVQQNAKQALAELGDSDPPDAQQILQELQDQFQFKNLPRRIDCFDISNIQGTLAVGSMVVCIDGSMRPSEYKRFKISRVEGSDDFAMMEEVIGRRYTRVKNEGMPMPDVIMVDGGKGQLHAAKYALHGIQAPDVDVIGIAKARGIRGSEKDRERIFTSVTGEGIVLDTSRKSAQLLQHIRDEAHRFAITYHRRLRKKANFHSLLEEIPGIGPKRRKRLLSRFGSLKRLKEASVDAIAATNSINYELAESIYSFLHADPQEAIHGHSRSETDQSGSAGD